MYYELTDRFVVAADLAGAWDFFTAAGNLSRITPPWLGFTNAGSNPARVTADCTLDYTIRWMGLPLKWRTRIIEFSPPHQFIDLQVRGPYVLWHHQHRFVATSDGTECFDRVLYKLPAPFVAPLIHQLMVKPQLIEIFHHRRRVIGENLGGIRPLQADIQIQRL